MSVIVVLAIIVAAGEGHSPATSAMVAASSEAVGSWASVQVHEAAPPSDDEASRIETTTSPRAVAEVLWLDAHHERARLRLHVARTNRWVDRTIEFTATDRLSERGRTLGFAIASMLPEADPALQVTSPPSGEPPAPASLSPPEPFLRRSIGLAAMASDGIAGPATGVGGAAELSFAVRESSAVRLSRGLWRGSISEVSATDVTAHVGAGGSWMPFAPTSTRPWGLGVGADALVVYQAISHVRATGGMESKAEVLPGADVTIDGRCRLSRNLELSLMAGPQIVFGTVDVTVVSSTATRQVTLPALRGLAQIGFHLRF